MIQPFCRAINIGLAYSDGTTVFPRSVTDWNNVFFTIIIFVSYGNLKMLVSTQLLTEKKFEIVDK